MNTQEINRNEKQRILRNVKVLEEKVKTLEENKNTNHNQLVYKFKNKQEVKDHLVKNNKDFVIYINVVNKLCFSLLINGKVFTSKCLLEYDE